MLEVATWFGPRSGCRIHAEQCMQRLALRDWVFATFAVFERAVVRNSEQTKQRGGDVLRLDAVRDRVSAIAVARAVNLSAGTDSEKPPI